MNRSLLIITWSILMPLSNFAQSTFGMESYYYTGTPGCNAIVPVIHMETAGAYRFECRYNYEEAHTFSFFTGKTIRAGRTVLWTVTPMVGYSTGSFSGLSLAMNLEAAWKKLYLTTQTQYSIATSKVHVNFTFSWSEFGFNFSDHFFGGVALQYNYAGKFGKTDPGFAGGLCFADFTVPFYVFRPFGAGNHFVLGVNYARTFRKKNKKDKP